MESRFISYSQHADDYLAWQILGKRTVGFVVEIGAFDGIHLSNSYALENLGWKSLCIEANPKLFAPLKSNRPRSSCISCAVVDSEDLTEVEFMIEEIGVLSGVSIDIADVKNRYKRRGLEFKRPDKIKVRALTLNNILYSEGIVPSQIDLISIDVEGYELNVLRGLNIDYYNPGLFIVEANTEEQANELLSYFKHFQQYLYLGSNRQNMFFVLKNRINGRILRNLDFSRFLTAKQYHPFDQKFAIQAVPPLFVQSFEFKEVSKNWFSKLFN
jgi:FkbM family methyltransferase